MSRLPPSLERVFDEVRHLAAESGPVALSAEYLAWIDRVETLLENRDGADKTWVERSRAQFERLVREAHRLA